MKAFPRTITVTLIALAVAGLFAVNTAAAQEPVAGLLISSGDMAFLQADHYGVRTPVPDAEVVGLFNAVEARYLATPYSPDETSALAAAGDEVPGLMITGADLRFIVSPGAVENGMPETWAGGSDRFGIGQ
ncbi:MAG: hypothetical protein ABIL58_29295 [Pseudomonadota bacterium]